MWRKIAWPTAGILLAALVSPAIPAAQAATGCRVDYTVQSQWAGGFQAAVTVQNLGSALNSWALTFTFPRADQRLTQGWNATWTQSGAEVKAVNLNWNGALPTNQSVSLGFLGSWSQANPLPTSFQVNGVVCTGGTTGPTPTPTTTTSPTPTQPPTQTPTQTPTVVPTTAPPAHTAPALHVSGSRVVTASGAAFPFYGVNRSGGEFACLKNRDGIWNG